MMGIRQWSAPGSLELNLTDSRESGFIEVEMPQAIEFVRS
jgi:hypothetical protein